VNLNQFNRILRQVFLLPVVALLLTAGALYWQIRGANATVNLIQESDARIAQATLVAKLIVDEESGLRGYETTLDTRFLQPYVEAESRLQTELRRLGEMTGPNSEQKRLIEDLVNVHLTWRDAFALPVIATVRA
jgi:CHASE3 domain sensor protein